MTQELNIKISQAIRLLRSIPLDEGEVMEIAYSGGKDSDVILQLAKEAGVPFRAIYKDTTIDPAGTREHVLAAGAEILRPKEGFFKLVSKKGLPSTFSRFCCESLKEYKVLDICVMGVRRSESRARADRYKEPIACRIYKGKRGRVDAVYPILEWSDADVLDFIRDRGIRLHPLYYREDGSIDIKRRLGCIGCPLASTKKRVEELKQNPGILRAYIKAAERWWDARPNLKSRKKFRNVYELFTFNLFYKKYVDFDHAVNQGFWGVTDCKTNLEQLFKVRL